MGKKFQVVLPDWMEEYLETIATKFDLTHSELLRFELSLGFIFFIDHFFPQFKAPSLEELGIPRADAIPAAEKFDREKRHKVLSRIYFEARKAADFHLNEERKLKKKR